MESYNIPALAVMSPTRAKVRPGLLVPMPTLPVVVIVNFASESE